ncbi:sulfotransferase [Sulfuritalea sp.]|uniref:sulfotransferase family protein n=1 Tax=Sulfuritalea sp. TaxID=2480090 RepID=UPI001ACB75F5|nr:sulfotransferase [Sulfuritalea sp.]MBN8474898.1 sulfotransferase [Sulfuritalea sp.]
MEIEIASSERNPSPVFLVSPVRSGSTLLRLMLDSHPGISNPGECDFLLDMLGDDGAFPDTESYVRWLSTNRIYLAKKLKIDARLSSEALVKSFVDQLRRENAMLTMNLHRHFHRALAVFPTARFIHLLRDPRDVAMSCLRMGWGGHVYHTVDIWRDAELSWERLRSSLASEQFIEIRYEHLVDDIPGVLGSICTFLGVPYSERMLDYSTNSTYGPPDRKLCYQWRKSYAIDELRLVEGKIGKMLVDRGYELSGYPVQIPGPLLASELYLTGKWRRARHQIGAYGMPLYFSTFLANRLGMKDWQDRCRIRKNAIDIRERLK